MKYEKTADTQLQYGSRYQAAFNDAYAAEEAASFLKRNARGAWRKQGSSLFLWNLDDAFHIRLYYNEGLKTLREAGGFVVS